MVFVGLIFGVAGGLYFAATLRKANWTKETARFSRYVYDSDNKREALFSYSGGTARVRAGFWGYSEGDTKIVYVDPTRRSSYSFSNRPGYIGLLISIIAAIWLFVGAGRKITLNPI